MFCPLWKASSHFRCLLKGLQHSAPYNKTDKMHTQENRSSLQSESSTVPSHTSRRHGIPRHTFKRLVLSPFLDVNGTHLWTACRSTGIVTLWQQYKPLMNINRPVDKEFLIECGCSAAPFTAIYYYIYYHIKNYYCIKINNNIFKPVLQSICSISISWPHLLANFLPWIHTYLQ